MADGTAFEWFIGISLAIIIIIAMYVFPFLVDRVIIKIKSRKDPDYAEKHKTVNTWLEPLISISTLVGIHAYNLFKGGKISAVNIAKTQKDARQFGLILLLVSGAVLVNRYFNNKDGLDRAKKGAVIALILAIALYAFSAWRF
jgi:uncharacterized membrane-anchored protein